MAAHDDVQYLAGSPVRAKILSALCEEPLRPTELTDRVDATRTTVQRILAGYLERDWVVKRGRRYTVTVTGRGVYRAYESLRADLERASELGPFASHIGPIADDLPWSALKSAEITAARDRDPFATVQRLVELISTADADRMRAVTPIVAEVFNEAAGEFIEGGGHLELTIDPGVLEASRAGFPDAVDRAVENGDVEVRVHPEPIEFGLMLCEEWTCLGAYDDENNVRAVVESDSPELFDWADEQYDRYRSRTVPLDEVLSDGEELALERPVGGRKR
ncbi:Transcriptional regulator, contains HTH domain [Halalkaliarchaeum sp. AArc-CO]|uniref:helix-turn-helix transcriptional regulator n=1 Tax=unclassified Halalkaliarchaeum TaxID=2678344 RepID=UPI00217D71C4|nr:MULTISPECIES: transcriptional regulator [unclassified Halalkaliarchaeum]MDR5674447.1 transcriptional regulator [Halalkaliarchaeum sp. AArc-GB]UWG51924.1 Transcriptional regulator, contains HTH domain [Halalkaliarchaeum sp. AArc-CO]